MNAISSDRSLSGFTDRVSRLDDPWRRLPVIVLVAIVTWLGLLTLFGLFLSDMAAESPAPLALEARLLELPGNGSPARGATSSSIINAGSPHHTTTLPAFRAASHQSSARFQNPTRLHRIHPIAQLHKRMVSKPAAHRVDEYSHSDEPLLPTAVPPAAHVQLTEGKRGSLRLTAPGNTLPPASSNSDQTNTSIGAGVSSGLGHEKDSGGASGPHPIYAPVPSIPDDMRDEVMQATAVVLFQVARDGSATVSLVARTDFPVLDQLLLETLSHWRFQPAVRNGVAVKSEAEVHLQITVR